MRPSPSDFPWIDQRLEAGFWDDRDNRVAYGHWLGQKLGYSSAEDWYQVSKRDFFDNHGGNLLNRYYHTIFNSVSDFFPTYEWKAWLFAGGVQDGFWKNLENQRAYMTWLFEQLGYSKPEDWYGISKNAFVQNGASGLLSQCFHNSPIEAVQSIYPDYQLLPWKFNRCHKGYWSDENNARTYLEWLGQELGYSKPEDWYQISTKDLTNNYGSSLVSNVWGGHPRQAAYFLYPEYDWKPWLFRQVPHNWWYDESNRKLYLDWLAKRLGYSRPEDWYQISKKTFLDNFGSGFLKQFGDSPAEAISKSLPDYEWKKWLFAGGVPDGFWKDLDNQRAYLEWLGDRLGYSKPEHWYGINKKAFDQNKGTGLLSYISHSLVNIVQSVYPEYQLLTWKFKTCPNGYWLDDANVRTYLKWLGQELGYSKPEDWYQISRKDLNDNYGSTLVIHAWGGNPRSAAYILFPEFDWIPWFFNRVPNGFWQDEENCRDYMQWLEKELGIEKAEGWYRVQRADFLNHSGSGFYSQACSDSLINAVNYLYPYFPWNPKKFSSGFRSQNRLLACVHQLYPDSVVKFNFLHPELRFSESNSKMEIDVYLPELEMAFEYQGEGHFMALKIWGGEIGLKKRQERDAEKRHACASKGITLVEVPYSWNGSKAELKQLIEAKLS